MVATGVTVGLAEWIIDDTCLVFTFFCLCTIFRNFCLWLCSTYKGFDPQGPGQTGGQTFACNSYCPSIPSCVRPYQIQNYVQHSEWDCLVGH